MQSAVVFYQAPPTCAQLLQRPPRGQCQRQRLHDDHTAAVRQLHAVGVQLHAYRLRVSPEPAASVSRARGGRGLDGHRGAQEGVHHSKSEPEGREEGMWDCRVFTLRA